MIERSAGVGCLPEGLVELPPGPQLAAVLATVDRGRLGGSALMDLVKVRNRQVSWEQAQLLADVHELSLTPAVGPDSTDRLELPEEYAEVELAYALTWTDRAAASLVDLADGCLRRLPAVHAALAAGRIDLPKAKVICHELELLDQAEARAVLERLLPEVDQLTTGQIRHRLRRLVLTVDPDAVRRRHRKALESRCVDYDTYSNGTAALSGIYLPAEKAAAAWNYIDRVATATKAAGLADTRGIDQIRADVFADLLAGVDPTLAGAILPAPRKGVINLRVDAETLLCLADRPGDLDGFGPVLADIARQLTAQIAEQATWRWTATRAGDVIGEGPITNPPRHYRPTAAQAAFVRARDITCRAPGCRRRARRCDIDHIHDYAHGGHTIVSNLCCLCRRHHRAKHAGRFRIRHTRWGLE
ncbi:MAG: DUF222 domain-containing protein, partial [Micromonosporaceae bacterium]